jgi:predicted AAA+ superfamily ATPase
MERYLLRAVKKDLNRKMVILPGPRQIGKTWLARELMKEFKNPQYLNYDTSPTQRSSGPTHGRSMRHAVFVKSTR